ncbi:MAG: hypothetical protein FJ100_00320 [Deltaproteobacteria bacterium]|nr:hypothetical protein [Deltaproteobacteria bacterium]
MRFHSLACACAVLVGGVLAATAVRAAVPSFAQVEGIMTSAGGGPAADGSYNATFALYAQQVGGTPLWTESGAVSVKSGQFSYQLGARTLFPPPRSTVRRCGSG